MSIGIKTLAFNGADLMKANITFQAAIPSFTDNAQVELGSLLNQDKLYIKIHLQLDWWQKQYPDLFSGAVNPSWKITAYSNIPSEWVEKEQYVHPVYWNLLALAENYSIEAYQQFVRRVNAQNITLTETPNFWDLTKELIPELLE